jgi:hypothetical protein
MRNHWNLASAFAMFVGAVLPMIKNPHFQLTPFYITETIIALTALALVLSHFLNKPGFRKFRELIDKKMKQTGDFYSSETTISDICNWRDDIAFEIRNAFWHREEKYKAFLAIDNPKLASSKEDALEFVKKAYSFLRDLKSNTTKDEIKRDYDHEENERYK